MRSIFFWILYLTLLYAPEIYETIGSTELHLADVPESVNVGNIIPESDSFKIDPEGNGRY